MFSARRRTVNSFFEEIRAYLRAFFAKSLPEAETFDRVYERVIIAATAETSKRTILQFLSRWLIGKAVWMAAAVLILAVVVWLVAPIWQPVPEYTPVNSETKRTQAEELKNGKRIHQK